MVDWSSLQTYLVIALLLLLFALVVMLGANSLFQQLVVRIRATMRGVSLPLELVAWPFRLLMVLAGMAVLANNVPLSARIDVLIKHSLLIGGIIGVTWFLTRLMLVFEQVVLDYYATKVRESEAVRKVATHISLARKIIDALLVLVAIAGALMTFDTVRQVGLSILASAGILSVMVGLAAQKSLTTLIAGVQIAITQPVTIGDEVVVENEKGTIEEITLTYVVMKIWDERRMILPITWFLDRPFENWTRTSPELLGSVFLSIDYLLSPDVLRQELERLVATTPLWDGRVVKLQVTNSTERSMEIRALVSAANASQLWDLRCLVREGLIAFLRNNYNDLLPHLNIEIERGRSPQNR